MTLIDSDGSMDEQEFLDDNEVFLDQLSSCDEVFMDDLSDEGEDLTSDGLTSDDNKVVCQEEDKEVLQEASAGEDSEVCLVDDDYEVFLVDDDSEVLVDDDQRHTELVELSSDENDDEDLSDASSADNADVEVTSADSDDEEWALDPGTTRAHFHVSSSHLCSYCSYASVLSSYTCVSRQDVVKYLLMMFYFSKPVEIHMCISTECF
jgi:hypothetical protein